MKEEIGLRIKKIREELNITQESLAKTLGISSQFLGMIEKGKNSISIEKLKILCDLSHHSADYILFGKEENITEKTKKLLQNFTEEQIEYGCKIIKELALIIKK